MILNDILQIVLAVIASSSVTSLALLRPKRRTGDTESYSLLLDDLNSKPAAVIDLPATGDAQSALFTLPQTITGTHDLYFRLNQPDTALLQWQFFSPIQGQ